MVVSCPIAAMAGAPDGQGQEPPPILPIEPPAITLCSGIVGANQGASTQTTTLLCGPNPAGPRVKCWDWAKGGTPRTCTSESGDYERIGHGVYYCPPLGEHAACDANGKPSDGTIDVCADGCGDPSTTPFYWSYVCDDGSCYDGGNYIVNSASFSYIYSDIVHLTGGTFGGYARI